jgi:hypothetical protein
MGFVDQVVHHQHRGSLDGFERFEGQQLRVARAGADQGDLACRVGVGEIVFHSDSANCKMWATCCEMGAGTGWSPAITL